VSSIRGVMALFLLILAGPVLAAPEPPQSLLQPLTWRSVGPFRGGRVLAVTGVPGEPSHFYFGAVNGGVWETRDAGRTWAPIFDSAPVGSIGALAVAPSDPHVIYVGTGEPDMRSDIAQGAGVYRSDDSGASWRLIGLADSQQIGRILVDPANPDSVLVAALGHPYGPNETRGVFRSTDGGRSWQRTLYRDADTGAIDLAFEPGRPSVVYTALWQTRRPPWNVYPPSSGPGGGLYKSLDGGRTWSALKAGLPDQPGRIGIGVSPAQPQRLYALIDAAAGGLYRSDDGGASWTRVSDDARIWKRGWYFGGVSVDPTDANIVYICNTGVYRSSDAGRTFLPVKGAPGGDDYHQLWIDPRAPERRILGVDQGAVITLDGGATWSSWFNQPTGQFYHVITDQRFPYWIYGAQQDSGAAGIPSRTDNIDGINLTEFRETGAGGESDSIAPDPDDPQIIFGGRVDRLDLRTGQNHSVPPTLAYPDLYRGTWTLPLVFGPSGSGHALYFGNQRIFRTVDRGAHWQAISPDLSRESPATPVTLDAPTVDDHEAAGTRRGVVYAIGPSPLDAALIWAGTDDGLVWRTRDGGGHWDNVTPAALTAWSKVGVVEPSHFDAGSAYIAVDRHRLDDPQPYIYRTRDGGASWTLIVAGIVDGGVHNSVNVVREDPLRRGLLYCGTEHGVYVSLDDGAHWQALQQNLPRTSVRDLQVHGADLVIATHGRGLWIMDDIAPLRSLAGDASGGTRLLPPVTAIRVRPTGFLGSPMPKDEPMGANPLPGAYLDYVLAADVAGPVQLTIRDAHGATVRVFRSDDRLPQAELGKSVIAPEWIVPPAALATGAGAHRFVWDLHYAPRQVLPGEDTEERDTGVWAPPGEYRVELQAGGQSYRALLVIVPDPRVKQPPAAFARQFALAREIEAARAAIAVALDQAARVHTAIAARRQGASAALAATLADADAQLLAVSDLAPEKRTPDSTGRPPSTTHGLRYLDAAFRELARAVDGADAAPSGDAERGLVRQRALLDAALAGWSGFRNAALPRLNTALQSAGAATIAP
jgi:photosystem II stability/assembly factor-like uncharacterized protein